MIHVRNNFLVKADGVLVILEITCLVKGGGVFAISEVICLRLKPGEFLLLQKNQSITDDC